MGSDTLIDDHVSQKQTKLAAVALHKHALSKQAQRESTELLPGKEEYVWLVVAVKKVHPEKKLKPFRIPVRHPIVDPRTSPVCLITKDPQREYKDLLEAQKISFISRVVGVTKLKGKFKPFEARRLLAKENGLFLADERVVPLLPKLLGKIFFDAKKQPIPVDLTKKDLKAELESAIESTYMHQNQGTCTSIKIANLSHTPAQTLANLTTALPEVAKRIRGGWDNIQSLSIKTSSSISLPIWSCELGAGPGGRWDGLSIGAVEEEDEEWGGIDGDDPKAGDEDSEESEKTPEPVKKVEKRVEKSNEKKRRVEETEAPSTKKAKLSDAESKKSTPAKTPTPAPAPSTPTSKPNSSKKGPSASVISTPTSKAAVVEPASEPRKSKSKGKDKDVDAAVPAPPPPTPATPVAAASAKPKSKKSVEETPTKAPVSSSSEKPKSSGAKSKDAKASEPKKTDAPLLKSALKNSSKGKAFTAEDLRAKQSQSGIEKKKVKIAKEKGGVGKPGKSKASIIGRK